MHVIIASRIYLPEPSAASFMLESIARSLTAAGHRVTVLTSKPPAGMQAADLDGSRVKRRWVLRDSNGYVRGYLPYLSFDVPLFFRLLAARRADVYIVEPPPTTGAIMRVALALIRRPYIYDAADVWSDAAVMATRSTAVLALLRRIEVFAWRGAAHVITISSGVADRMRELGSKAESTVVGFGVDASVFRHITVASPRSPYFVYAGSYSEWHGASIFVEAFARFRSTYPLFRLIFVGNGAERAHLESVRDDLGVEGVEFRDTVDAATLNVILAGATASLASLKPAQGYDYAFTTKLYASIAAGCPVIFSGVGPTGEFIHAHAVDHPVGVALSYDSGSVADAMRQFAAAPLPDNQRESLSAWARPRFALSSIADRVTAVVENVGRS
jgi:glycosyltransferase involved in cell wall biosynthesis